MEMTRLVTRIVLLPLEAAAFGADVVAQSTRSVHKMAEKSVRSLIGDNDEADDDDDED